MTIITSRIAEIKRGRSLEMKSLDSRIETSALEVY